MKSLGATRSPQLDLHPTRHTSPDGYIRTRQLRQRAGYVLAAFGWEGNEFVVHWCTNDERSNRNNGN